LFSAFARDISHPQLVHFHPGNPSPQIRIEICPAFACRAAEIQSTKRIRLHTSIDQVL